MSCQPLYSLMAAVQAVYLPGGGVPFRHARHRPRGLAARQTLVTWLKRRFSGAFLCKLKINLGHYETTFNLGIHVPLRFPVTAKKTFLFGSGNHSISLQTSEYTRGGSTSTPTTDTLTGLASRCSVQTPALATGCHDQQYRPPHLTMHQNTHPQPTPCRSVLSSSSRTRPS